MKKIKEYAERGYTHAVALDLSKYFDTLNHEKLLNLLRRDIKDERVIQWIKRYLKSGVMENGVVMETEEGSPQGGNISPLLANIYLNEFDQEYEKRGVKFVRYADDIVLLAKSDRAAKRLLETSTKYLEGTLKLKVNQEKSRVVSVFAIRNFKYLGFTLGKNGKGIYIRVHGKSWKKMKSKLKELSSRRSCQSIRPSLQEIKEYMRGWLNYYGVADMKKKIDDLNGVKTRLVNEKALDERTKKRRFSYFKADANMLKNLRDQIIDTNDSSKREKELKKVKERLDDNPDYISYITFLEEKNKKVADDDYSDEEYDDFLGPRKPNDHRYWSIN